MENTFHRAQSLYGKLKSIQLLNRQPKEVLARNNITLNLGKVGLCFQNGIKNQLRS